MNFLKKWGIVGAAIRSPLQTTELETIRKITQKLDGLDPQQAKHLALFACLLSRVAHVDFKITETESQKMEEVLIKLGNLSPELAVLVIEMAKMQNRLFGGTENFLYSREFLDISTYEERVHLLECLFAVAAADQSVTTEETNEIRQIASELKIEHHDYVGAKQTVREFLEVLKR